MGDSDEDFFIMFYNVENLFDTVKNPTSNDASFTPSSEKKWNTHKYNYKLQQLAKVFTSIKKEANNNTLPDIIGLCEVENKIVINDLLNQSVFNSHDYTIIHQESADLRGIDCALLFDNKFELLKHDYIRIDNPESERPTRDIVYAKLKYNDNVFNIFVNHWPSRWGGQIESNYKRVFAANILKKYIQNNTSSDEYTLIMGDFNDYPTNESLKDVLVNDEFINLMQTDKVTGMGSYNFKGDWNWLDQIILSQNFINNNLRILSGGSFQSEYMLYESSKLNLVSRVFPSRTFGGNTWFGGFSDHLPIYFRFNFK